MPSMSRYHHLAHMRFVPVVKAGDYVHRGDLLGYVGSTGHSSGPHVHYEVMYGKPPTWRYYPVGKSREEVRKMYQDPTPFIQGVIPAPFTFAGSGYLSWAGNVWHPGIDINSPNDLGKPIVAPVDGRVRFAEGMGWVRNMLGKLIPSFYNGGWGNHTWIEQDEANPGIQVPV